MTTPPGPTPPPQEPTQEHLTDLTVDLLLEVRAQYLAAGANALKHWEQLTERVRAATRSTTGPEEWATKLLRDLQIAAPSKACSSAMLALAEAVRKAPGGPVAWLALVEREYAYMMAAARRQAEERKDARAAAHAPPEGP